MIELVASFLMFIGSVFVFSAALGLLRMPDPISRLQTGTKATTLGAGLILSGLAVLHPERAVQYVLIIAFVFISNPISSHALARAGLKTGRTEGDVPEGERPEERAQ
ncbi:monovalent cation/H(+) antiporter subunit G [Sedimentitalea sp. JM2-8]|uniref:Monovalent cation/H(+) antiporter subunit G n=1 Tax=Sedimentitalea xiamensis TaxID=3050037 RepID=A0ABT7FCQ5_9RHOB|nr:monovalent cation/H(+) antiporter subunit G [Sedimentitalea xiamensis]MDK3072896.1 monovalent cation/H(+) antiporter subunit G [Sedimentitalea xiamensis]